MSDKLSSSMQDNVLTLACFSDSACSLVRNTVDVSMFTSRAYRTIIEHAYAYIDQYGKAPKDHIADELEAVLKTEGDDAEVIAETIGAARELAPSINEAYVLGQLDKFTRLQTLKLGIVTAHEKLKEGDLDAAEVELGKAIKARAQSFEPGLTLGNVLNLVRSGEELRETISTGIDALDKLHLGPARKELHLFIAPPKRGKSWWLAHMAKRGIMQRWKGVIVTLELADKFYGKRELQSLFALTSRENTEATYSKLVRGEDKQLEDIEARKLKRPSLTNEAVQAGLASKIDDLHYDDRLLIKEFPTGSLTVKGLEAYLDNLERTLHFQPDFLVLDYADLMYLDPKNLRTYIGENFKALRGLAIERNLALITASQSNRLGAGARLITDTHVAEDFSKIATADCVMTYNQTAMERARNIARLFVANGRVEMDRFAVLITQSYASGQFVLDSMLMREEYWSMIGQGEDEDEGEEE